MKIEDFGVEIKKVNKKKKTVILNVILQGVLEIRGWTARPSTFSKNNGLKWWVSPPCKQGKNGQWYWWVNFSDLGLWKELEALINDRVEEEYFALRD